MKDQEKQMNILRSEASRLGYHGLPLDKFMRKAGGEVSLSLNSNVDELNREGITRNERYKDLQNRRKRMMKNIASITPGWHDIGSIFAMVFSLIGLSFLWQNLIWGDLVYQQWIVFGFVIACATMGSLINEYAEGVSDEDKHTLIITLKILAVALTFVFSLESLELAALARAFILSCLAGVVVHGINILFMPITKGLVKMVRYLYLFMRKWSLNNKIRKSQKEFDDLNCEFEISVHHNEYFVETVIHQLRLDYLMGQLASRPEGINGEEIVNDNQLTTEEMAHA